MDVLCARIQEFSEQEQLGWVVVQDLPLISLELLQILTSKADFCFLMHSWQVDVLPLLPLPHR